MRVVTINIHQGVPGSLPLGDENEDIRALQDVSEYIRKTNADVVLMQEVDDDRAREGKLGVTDQFTKLSAMMGANTAHMTPAVLHANGDRYGTAIFTRNGFSLTRTFNVDLPNALHENRSAGISEVRAPGGSTVTVVNTHLANGRKGAADRVVQIAEISRAIESIRATGAATFTEALTHKRLTVNGLPQNAVIFGGDLNSASPPVDRAVSKSALHNTMFDPDIMRDPVKRNKARKPTSGNNRIDHIYLSNTMSLTDTWVDDVPTKALPKGPVTDHRAVVADIKIHGRSRGHR